MSRPMLTCLALVVALTLPAAALGQGGNTSSNQAAVENALSAAPPAVAANARVMGHNQEVLRQGSNGWTCLPDMPDVPNNSPMCLDEQWLGWMDAYMNRRQPNVTRIGIAYMLQEDFPVSNVDPFATGPTADNQWLENAGPHVMMIVPDPKMLDGFPTDPNNGGPWVMWKGTPYAHLMIPTPARSR